jgi:DNA (cytosine-5)-methyltransferase 1
MNFLDLFAGIGGFRMGMEMAGHKCVGYVEIDKFARKSYEAIFDTKGEWTAHDIRTVSDDDLRLFRGKVDVICGGFPCQAFSVAGKRLGFEDTRGTLFFEIARFAKEIQPRYLFLENVKGLLSHDKGRTFETILLTLDELGYDAEWQVLNSKDFGVPQNRERVFIIGHLRGQRTRKIFPITREGGEVVTELKQLIGGKQGMRVYDPNGLSVTLSSQSGGWGEKTGLYLIDDQGRRNKKLKPLDICPTLRRETHGNEPKVVQAVLTSDREDKRQNGRRMKEPGEPMFTLTAQDRHGVAVLRYVRTEYGKQIRKQYEAGEIKEKIGNMRKLEPRTDGLSNTITTVEKDNYLLENYRIRKLTPRECWRLQGFPDWAFDRAAEVNSDSQLYKQAGNSVTVNVIYEIAKRMGFDD